MNPDLSWIANDSFSEAGSKLLFSHPLLPNDSESYTKDPRAVANRCDSYVKSTGIADTVSIGMELEFNLLKGIKYQTDADKNIVELEEIDGWPNNAKNLTTGYRIGHRSMHLHPQPNDQFIKIREKICIEYEKLDIQPVHHGHEAGPSQQEIGVAHKPLLRAADELQLQKHVIKNVAIANDLTATFMPRPIPYAEGNGLHVNISLWKDGRNIFHCGPRNPSHLSQTALHFIGGILYHLRPLNAITNPTVNSYRRLNHIYSLMRPAGWGYHNRLAAIRVPHFISEEECRIEIRFPDPSSNPYLALSALICAGIEGIEERRMPPEEERLSPKWFESPFNASVSSEAMAPDLRYALEALANGSTFLTANKVFDPQLIQAIVDDGSFFWHWAASTPAPQEYQVFFTH
ncbi:hypothetical protein P3W85_16980 [Cupriavidus basilensis]|uniref:GS catalytic domain-containing protein n=1 Tax=Cupriavidus basilensis TaxID=68895 RepID=A0ABT6APV8_9BURK|nr:hypothetical protein [Cupriavidus basilensis]MDF3834640.1 hypothetical protein [Cupriavidus basilensis]